MAYASDQAEEGNLDVWIRKIPGGASLRLTSHGTDDTEPSLSPDGQWIVFRSEREGGGIYLIPAFGGKERLVASGGRNPRFSPDGKNIAYWVGEHGHPRYPGAKLFIVPVADGTPRQLCTEMADARYPVWAPDSRNILFQGSRNQNFPPDEDAEWWLVSLDGSPAVNTGALKRLTAQKLEVHANAAFWAGEDLVFSAARGQNVNLWRAPFDRLKRKEQLNAQRLTFGAAFETSPAFSASGRLAFCSQRDNLRLWTVQLSKSPEDASLRPYRVTNTADLDAFPSATPDAKWLVFTRTSSEVGVRQIWLKDLASGNESALTTSMEPKSNPVLTSSGAKVAYDVKENGSYVIYWIDIGWIARGGTHSAYATIVALLEDGRRLKTGC